MISKEGCRAAPFISLLVISCWALTACSESPAEDPCEGFCHQRSTGAVVGVTQKEICLESFCTDNSVSCKQTYYVLQGSAAGGDGSLAKPFTQLSGAAKKAKGGDCVVIGAGDYTGDTFDGGINLLGAGSARVRIQPAAGRRQALLINGGGGGKIRGLGFSSAALGLEIHNVQKLMLEQVRVNNTVGVGLYVRATKGLTLNHVTVRKTNLGVVGKSGPDAGAPDAGPDAGVSVAVTAAMGIVLSSGTEAKIQNSFIEANTQLGLIAAASKVDLEGSVIKDNGSQTVKGSFGVVIQCSDKTTAACATALGSRLTEVDVLENYGIGIVGAASKLELNKLNISKTKIGGGFSIGVSIQVKGLKTADVKMLGCAVSESVGQGVLVDGASTTGEDPEPWYLTARNNNISNNLDRGIWIQNINKGKGKVLIEDNTISGNSRIGVGIINAKGVQVKGGSVSGTKLVPTLVRGNSVDMGDGLQVMELSDATIDGVSFDQNQRLSILFDTANGSAAKNVFTSLPGKPEIVLQGGSEKVVKLTDNKDKGGAGVSSTIPKVPFIIDKQAITISSLPSLPVSAP